MSTTGPPCRPACARERVRVLVWVCARAPTWRRRRGLGAVGARASGDTPRVCCLWWSSVGADARRGARARFTAVFPRRQGELRERIALLDNRKHHVDQRLGRREGPVLPLALRADARYFARHELVSASLHLLPGEAGALAGRLARRVSGRSAQCKGPGRLHRRLHGSHVGHSAGAQVRHTDGRGACQRRCCRPGRGGRRGGGGGGGGARHDARRRDHPRRAICLG